LPRDAADGTIIASFGLSVANGSLFKEVSMARRTLSGILITVLGLLATQAHAIPVNYTISGNGIYGNPVGSFTYNAATNQFTNVDIWSLDHFTVATGNSSDSLLRATGELGSVLRLVFTAPLSDAGGTLNYSGYEQGILTLGFRVARAGSATSIVPAANGAGVYEPGATLLLILGLAAVFVIPRRRLAVRGS
jgi:hypothetical protein